MNEHPPNSEAATRASSASGERDSSRSIDLRAAYAAERAESVDKRIAIARFTILGFAAFVYIFLMDHVSTIPWLAYSVLAIGWAYALPVYIAERSPQLAQRMVFMTGGAFTRSAEEFLRQVPNPSVDKPFAAADLLNVIQGAIAVPQSKGIGPS